MSANLYTRIVAACVDQERVFATQLGDHAFRYRDIFALAGRLANVMREKGVEPEDRVAVQVDKSVEALALYLACIRLGAIFLPLNTAYTMAELEYFIRDAEPRLVVSTPEREKELRMLANWIGGVTVETLGAYHDGTLLDAASTASEDFDDVARGPDDLAAILYTSGTTGRSKGAMLTHRNLTSNAETLVEYWRFTMDDVLIHALPIFHTHGLFVATNIVLLSGASMIFMNRFDPAKMRAAMLNATVMMGVPTFYTRLLQESWLDRSSTASMRLFISGSAPLLAEIHREWCDRTDHAILERYGMTETNMITSNPYDGKRVPGSVGFPLPGVELRITDPESGVSLHPGEIGMIEVRGPNVFKGYWRMPDKTKSELRDDGFFVTGDLGKQDANGCVSIVGRGKDLVITGGYNVYPKEVELEIDGIDGIVESAVIGVPHPDFGEGVTAVVVKSTASSIDERAILGKLDSRLAKYKLPKRIIFVDDLPRNSMGKVLKADLRQRYGDLYRQ